MWGIENGLKNVNNLLFPISSESRFFCTHFECIWSRKKKLNANVLFIEWKHASSSNTPNNGQRITNKTHVNSFRNNDFLETLRRNVTKIDDRFCGTSLYVRATNNSSLPIHLKILLVQRKTQQIFGLCFFFFLSF